MRFFKGYVETKDKKCIEKFKNRDDFKTYEQVKLLDEFAGILDKDTILIDIDEMKTSDIIFKIVQDLKLKCRVYETTKGKHFLFKNDIVESNRTGASLVIGLKADIKIGTRNSYEVLKYKGKERTILWDTPEKEVQAVPRFFLPLKKKINFQELGEGDGRNQELFNHILTLQSEGLTISEIKESIRIINQYVFSEPLDDKELEVILRDEAFEKISFFNGSTFLFDNFSKHLKANNNIIKVDNQLCIYKDGYYSLNLKEIESEMITQISRLGAAKRKEVLQYLELICENQTRSSAAYMCFSNGIYNIDDEVVVKYSSEYIITNKINWDYDPDAYHEITDKTLDKLACHDTNIRLLLEEIIGYCFYTRNELGKAFILTGDGSNGKSTFLTMVKHLIGIENMSSLDIKELTERFKNSQLAGKLVNIGDDIGEEFIVDTSVFRKLVTGERMTVEMKGKDPFQFNNYAKFLFSANKIPRMRDPTGAVKRRMVIIPFDAKFSPDDEDYDPYIIDKLLSEGSMKYLIKIGMEGLRRVLKNKKFTESKKVQEQIREYELSNNPILGFFEEIELSEILNEPTKSIFQRYTAYCNDNNLQPMASVEFSRKVCKQYNLRTSVKKIKNKTYRVFEGVTD